MAREQDNKLAKRLARLVVEAGESRLSELRPALERIIQGRSAADRKAFLKQFHKSVIREVARDTLTIESATELDTALVDNLVQSFGRDRKRPLQMVQTLNPDLIAGLRVRLGDTVYDASLAHNLQSLSRNLR